MSSNTQQTPFIKKTQLNAGTNLPYQQQPPSNTGNYTIKPVFDVTNFGRVERLYCIDPTATYLAVTNSTTTRASQFSSAATAPFQPIKDIDVTISNTDSMALAKYANNTDADINFAFTPLTDSYLTVIKFNVAFGLNVSVAGAGTVTFSRVTVDVTWADSGEPLFESQNVNTGLTGIAAATGSQLFYMNIDFNVNPDVRIYAGRPIRIRMRTVSSDTAAATRQMGIFPFFTPQAQLSPAVPLSQLESSIDLHFYPALDQGQQSLTDALQSTNAGRRLDYSGLSQGNIY